MWHLDKDGLELSGPREAFLELRSRAQRAIIDGDAAGYNARQNRIRLRDDSGDILFEGTLEEAARLVIDGRVYLPPKS